MRFLLFILLFLTLGAHAYADESAASSSPELSSWLKQDHEFLITRPYEAGVQNRLLTEYFGQFTFSKIPWLAFEPGLSLSYVENWGPTLLGLNFAARIEALHSEIITGFQEERWPDWEVTENRFILYWQFHASDRVTLAFGGGLRAPVYGPTSFWQTFGWPASSMEVGPLYRLEWLMVSVSRFGLSFLFFNYDRMRFYTIDDLHFTFVPAFQITPQLKLLAMLGTAAKGVSGGVISFDQYSMSLGVNYVP